MQGFKVLIQTKPISIQCIPAKVTTVSVNFKVNMYYDKPDSNVLQVFRTHVNVEWDRPDSNVEWEKPNTTWCLLRRHHNQQQEGVVPSMQIRPKANSREVTSSSRAAKQTTNRNSTNKRGAPPRRDPGSGTAGSQILFQPTSRREVPALTSTRGQSKQIRIKE